MKKFIKGIRNFFIKIYVLFLKMLPIKKNRIYFVSNNGRYSCNPKALFEYLYKNHKNEFDFCYICDKPELLPKDVKTARYKSLKNLYYLYTSKYIVNNFRFSLYFRKRKKQTYIQTWHGGPVPMKAIEGAVEDKLNKDYVDKAKIDGRYIDYLTVGSSEIERYFKKYFWCDGKILNIGTPRYDELINSNENVVKKAKKQLNLPLDKKLILIAPTFKNNKSPEYDIVDNKKIINIFKEYHNEDVIVAYRFHPNIAKSINKDMLNDAIDLTWVEDSTSVVFASDYIITDFSSIAIDGIFAKKYVIGYSPSIKDYLENERDLWADFNKYPTQINEGQENLFNFLKTCKSINKEDVFNKMKKDYGITEDGHACENIYNLIIKGENK